MTGRSVRAALLAATLGALAAGCGGSSSTLDYCQKNESLELKVSGTCPGGAKTMTLSRLGCALAIANAPLDIGLPPIGAVPQDERPLRQGGWQIWGDLASVPKEAPPAVRFRRCVAERVGWRLEVACIDGAGQDACHATLTE